MTVLLNDEIMEFDVVKDSGGKNITKQSINGLEFLLRAFIWDAYGLTLDIYLTIASHRES